MGKFKQSLGEDIDVTDSRDVFEAPEPTMPTRVDFAVNNLTHAIADVDDITRLELMQYMDELSDISVKLDAIVDDLMELSREPF